MKSFLKTTLDNSWFCMSVGLFVSVCVIQLVLEIHREREDILGEFGVKCPDGFISWENTVFEIRDKFEVDGDSLIDFEKRIESGCRPFDFTGIPRVSVDSLLDVHSVIHYTWIQGLMNLSEGTLLRADTTHFTKTHKYR